MAGQRRTPPDRIVGEPATRYGIWHPGLAVFALLWLFVVGLAFPNWPELTARHWPLVLVGFFGALVGNATAVGGGIVFVPVMILWYRIDPVTSLKMALVVQAFGMSSGALAWAGRRELGIGTRKANLTVLAAALVGALFGGMVLAPSALLVKGLFGPVSIAVGLALLLLVRRGGQLDRIPTGHLPLHAAAAVAGGLITAWVAIGVGEVVAAALILCSSVRPERAIGFGVLMLAYCSLLLGALHAFVLGGVPWEMVAFLVPGVVFGARFGPPVAVALGPTRLKFGFGVVAILDGALFLWQALRTVA